MAMEGLHVALVEASRARAFKGISLGPTNLEVSHLFHVDDVIILYDWEFENARRFFRILKVFLLALGLKINLLKSKLTGFGVEFELVEM